VPPADDAPLFVVSSATAVERLAELIVIVWPAVRTVPAMFTLLAWVSTPPLNRSTAEELSPNVTPPVFVNVTALVIVASGFQCNRIGLADGRKTYCIYSRVGGH